MQRTIGHYEMLKGEARKNTPLAYSVPNDQSSKHTSNSIIETEEVVFMYLGIHMYICMHTCV